MIRDEIMEKLSPLWEDETFVTALAEAESDDDIINILADRGIGVTADEVNTIKASANVKGELGEEDLEDVSGGVVISTLTAAGAMALGWGIYKLWLAWKKTRR